MFESWQTDKQFLQQLCQQKYQTKYARITALDLNEVPLEIISGKITGGSINIDGTSIVRRTCQLNMIAENRAKLTNAYWTFKERFNLEVGLKNLINSNYPEIIWFPMGVYVLTSFSAQENTNSLSISLSGSDKMCLLNGDLAGVIPSQVDFGQVNEEQADGTFITRKLLLKDIILNAVHSYGKEPYHNIYIMDLDQETGMNLLQYIGDQPMYLLYNAQEGALAEPRAVGFTFHGEQIVTVNGQNKQLAQLPSYYEPTNLISNIAKTGTVFYMGSHAYVARKITYGDLCGYEPTELVYAGELVASPGENVANAVLEKIKNMLGNYEYFYDEYGHFIFQKKKTYLQNSWTLEGNNILSFINLEQYLHTFTDSTLFQSLSFSPDIKQIKNDFTVWGSRKSVDGKSELPFHMRLVIDKKPTTYTSPYRTYSIPKADETIHTSATITSDLVDWRELIYCMAEDWTEHHHEIDFAQKIQTANSFAVAGVTGYEDYYTEFLAFWREIYNPAVVAGYDLIKYSDNPVREDGGGLPKTIYTTVDQILTPGSDLWNNTSAEDIYAIINKDGVNYHVKWIDTFQLNNIDSTNPTDITQLYVYKADEDNYVKYVDTLEFPYEDSAIYFSQSSSALPLLANDTVYTQIKNLLNLDSITYEQNGEKVPYKKTYDIYHLPSQFDSYCRIQEGLRDKSNRTPTLLEAIDNRVSGTVNSDYSTYRVMYSWTPEDSDEEKDYDWSSTDITRINSFISGATRYCKYYYVTDQGQFGKIVDKNNLLYFDLLVVPTNTSVYKNINYYNGSKSQPLAKQLIDMGVYSLKNYYVTDNKTYFLNTICPDKRSLYVKLQDGSFQLLTEYAKAHNLFTANRVLYKKSESLRALSSAEAAAKREYLNLYTCDWQGNIDTTMIISRLKHQYYVVSGKYNPIQPSHDAYQPGRQPFWNRMVEDSPELLHFWFEIIDVGVNSQLEPYSRSVLGHKQIVKNEKTVTSIYHPAAPQATFGTMDLHLNENTRKLFVLSSLGQTAHEYLDDLIYKHTYLADTVTASIISFYWLQPNRKVQIHDDERELYEDFIINKISIPLEYSGLMQLTLNKCSSIGFDYVPKIENVEIEGDEEIWDGGNIEDGEGEGGEEFDDGVIE